MSTRKSRIDGGAYRRYTRMVALNCKPPKDRTGARKRPNRKRKEESHGNR